MEIDAFEINSIFKLNYFLISEGVFDFEINSYLSEKKYDRRNSGIRSCETITIWYSYIDYRDGEPYALVNRSHSFEICNEPPSLSPAQLGITGGGGGPGGPTNPDPDDPDNGNNDPNLIYIYDVLDGGLCASSIEIVPLSDDPKFKYSKIYGLNFDIGINGQERMPVVISGAMCHWANDLSKNTLKFVYKEAGRVLEARLNTDERFAKKIPHQSEITSIFYEALEVIGGSSGIGFIGGWNPCGFIHSRQKRDLGL